MCVLLACLLLLPSALADAIDLSGMSDDDITGRVNRIKFPENRDFNLELYLRFSGNMSENQKFCVHARSAKNAEKPYLAKPGGLFLIRIQWWRRVFRRYEKDRPSVPECDNGQRYEGLAGWC